MRVGSGGKRIIMRDKYNAAVFYVSLVLKQRHNLLRVSLVKIACGLVCDDYVRVVCNRTCDGDALLLAARQRKR
jgi:hypothetical protein